MVYDLIYKLKKFAVNMYLLNRKLDLIRIALGRIEFNQIKIMNQNKVDPYKNLQEFECKIFSQWGEDGIIQYLVNNLDIEKKIFVEFGVENYTESNTRFLLINNNWSGLVIDGDKKNIEYIKKDDIYWKYNIKAEEAFITVENINNLIKKNGIEGNIGLLSVDIDGNDYWVWQAIDVVTPAIVICEYNSRLGKEEAITVPYDPSFVRHKKHYSGLYYGASIKAFTSLAAEKGYSLVGGNSNGCNLFFVKNTLLNDCVKQCCIDEAFQQAQYRESRDKGGKLSFIGIEEEIKILETLDYTYVNKEGKNES